MRRYLSLFVTLLTLGIIFVYLNNNRELITPLTTISPLTALYLILLRALFLLVNGLFLLLFLAEFGVKLSFKEWFGLSVVTSMGNYLTPFSGGLVARAAYLKQRHAFPYAQFLILLSSNYLITFAVISLLGLLFSIYLIQQTPSGPLLVITFAAIFLAIIILFFIPTRHIPGQGRLIRTLNKTLQGWQLIRHNYPLIFKLVFLTLINILLNGYSFWLAYTALGLSISFIAATLISLMSIFSLLINLTPANLGIHETFIALASTLLGVGAGEGLVVALLLRTAMLVSIFTMGPLFSYLLTQELTNNSQKTV